MTFRSYGSSYITSIKAMFAYSEGTLDTTRYRIWDGASWGTEVSASTTASTIQWVVLKSSPKRDEKILGTLASTGAIHVQVWNGSSWSVGQILGSGVGTTNDAYRGFDIAYEQTLGRAIVVFVQSTTASDPQYIIWNGSSWTAPATIDIPTTGVIYWVKLTSSPISNQIALMTLDANADIAGIIWDGNNWGNAKTLTTTGSTATRECFAVEYEQQSGYSMFIWGEVATDLYYWRWSGTEWLGTTKTLLDIPAQGGVSNWISLKADPNSNRLMLAVQDAGADLNTRQWSGTAWDTATEHPEHDSTVENVGSRNFDIEYETFSGHTGHAILVWGDGATARWIHWTPTTGSSGWSSATVLTGSDDTAVTQLRRNRDGTIFAAILDDPASATDDLVEYRWNGSAWSSRLAIEGTPSLTAQPMMEPFMVAPDVHQTPTEYTMEVEFTGLSNTDPWNQLVWTIDSAWTTDNVAVTLQLYNYTLGGYPTSGNGYIAYTSSPTPNTDETKNQTITTNPDHFRDSLGSWKIKVKGVKSTTKQFDFKADLVEFEVTLGDTAPPVWSNAGTNITLAGQPTLFYVKWTDNVGLSGFIFGTNNTGTWTNDTWIAITGTTNWSNETKILNDKGGVVVLWRVWANDTSNNWNDTEILSLTTTQLPVASFTYSPSTPYTGETVTFNASSSYDPDGTIVSYFWDFGDGINGTGVTATHAYADNGVYTVTLTVTDNDGLTDTDSQAITVLNRPPFASFTENATTVYTGQIVYFNASASYDPDGEIVSYLWDFGDGTNTTGITASHSYADNGTYTVILTVTDDDGATATATATKTVLNRPPIASFTESAETVFKAEVIYFNASFSYDPDGSIISYFWDFGDEANATGIVVDHAYTNIGTYTVTLTVTDNDGATGTETAVKTVLNRPPVAQFTESATTVFTSETIHFNASNSYDLDGSIVSYFWDFGDGTNASGLTVSHAYVDNGIYTVTLTVTDNEGATGTTTATKTVLNRPPVASFTESATVVLTGEVIHFNASTSYDPDGVIVSYFWDFGDNTNASGATASHAYSNDGKYVVTLTVTDDDSATASATSTKTVLNRPPAASFTESATVVLTGEVITFNASESYDPDGTIVSYLWDFGDGTNTTDVVVTHAYADNGSYTVTLTVTDDDAASAIVSATKTVLNRPPVALFTESATTVFTGEVIHFDASASYDPDGTIVSYLWDFGDGTNATGIVVQHSYVDDGVYTVTLTITDNDGASSSATDAKKVLNRPPVASFTESATIVYKGEVIHFNASQSYDPDGTIVSYFWDFSDGTNATGATVDHSYINVGTYTVTLTVTDNDGATASTSATKTVLSKLPVASFTESATIVYTGEIIYFNASSSYDPDGVIISYFWDFGDGTNGTGEVVNHAYADDGNYTVTLTVTDDDGSTASSTATKTALNRPPVASFTESAETVYTGEAITFNASASHDPDGSIVSYKWDFGDGNITTVFTPFITHAYADNGTYEVTLIVTDNDGATASASSIKTVLNRSPAALFTESATTVFTNEIIYFNASDSYDLDGIIVSYFWDFGDGTDAMGVIVEHSYAENGTYIVTLTVTDDDDASASTSATKTVLNRPPVAIFTESAETVYTGETITFNASNSYDLDGSIVSYFWDFGDATNATGVVASHAYADDGAYTVTLIVTDNDGAVGTATSTKTILNRSPIASFTESAETALTGESIYFNASASYDPDGVIVSYFWDFGDGTNATGVNVNHAYVDDGTYTVTLTVTDEDKAAAIATSTKTVLNRPPVASFSESAEMVFTGEIIYFNASASYDSDGVIVSYFWTFGDGTNATGATVEHAYADDGVYTATLTVTDDDGAIATASAIKTVLNRPPIASFTESATTVYTGEIIYFNATSSYDPDGTIVSYFWTFGDGTNASGITVDHAYVDNGVYAVTLTVTDDDGAITTSTATKTVLNRAPTASFTESATTIFTGEIISFNASDSYDSDGSIISYFWSFGDGTNATGVTVDHAYADDGIYTVTLAVTDNDGAAGTATAIKTVLNRPPVALFTENATTVLTGVPIRFNASGSYDLDGTIVSSFWDFGDGTNATGIVVDHAYLDDGAYTVTLTVTDDDGATNIETAVKTILNRPPVAVFSETAETVYTGEIITFNASASYDLDGTIVSYFWDFGDGTNASGDIVTYAYADNGSYTVALTVTDDDGATATATAVKTVLNRPPIASFTESATTVYTGEAIFFDAIGSYDSDGSITSYFWDFGDGTNATGIIVEHVYQDNGVYTVTLMVTDDDGVTATATSTKYVLNRPPISSFTYSPTLPIVGETVTFNASSSYDPDGSIISYQWDFGDGNVTTIASPIVTHIYTTFGNYTVTLTVTDNDGDMDTSTKIVTVRDYPTAAFTYSPSFPIVGETVTFNASSSAPNGGVISSYLWDFGDGTPSVNTNNSIATHVYSTLGNYTVTLTVTDSEGLSDTATDMVRLRDYPYATFTFSPDYPIEGETVTFDASSTIPNGGVITSYQWNFGDGNITTVTDPIIAHVYSVIGNYTVTLTVTDSEELSDSESKTVSVRGYPIAAFTYTPEAPYVGDTVTFNASLSDPNGGVIISYLWDFGDGSQILNTTNPITTHIYTLAGNYTVTLIITDSEGLSDTDMRSVVVAKAPIATFTYSPQFPKVGETVTFNASGSYDPNGYIVNYTWNFGDGNLTTVTTPVITHAYTSTGVYTVILTITDNDGYTDTATATVTLGTPKASFTYTPEFPIMGQTITFNASESYDPNGYIVSYVWNFGDGNITTATNPIIVHVYDAIGNYTVALTVADNQGLTDTTAQVVSVEKAPEASFTYTPATPYVGDTVTFDASSSTPSRGNITSYVWDFGDGSPIINTTDPIKTHFYKAKGNYTVSLTITDSAGLTNTAKKTIAVLQSPVAIFTYSPTYPKAFDTVTFNSSDSYDANGYIISYVWDFGDGNITTVTNPIITHVYKSAGNYTLILIVADNEGYTHTRTQSLSVSTRPPAADFIISPDFPIARESVTFNASTSYDLDGYIISYRWNFGDGNITTVTSPIITHVYESYGNYTVIITVTDNDNLANNKTCTMRVRDYPVADFTISPSIGDAGSPATFNASLSIPNGGVILSYFWDFGDGTQTNTTDPIVTHVFNNIGNYTVTLYVTDSEGLSGTRSKVVQIAEKPTANFSYSPANPYVGDTVTFNASDSYDVDGYIVGYVWDFGDGSPIQNTTNPLTNHTYNIGGNFTVKLTVIDDLGFNNTSSKLINIGKTPVAVFTYSPDNPIAGEVVTFNASESFSIIRPIANYTWNFGDGNVTTVTDPVIAHIYLVEGTYSVTLEVMDTSGYFDTNTKTIIVRNYPIADFTYSPSPAVKNKDITFDASVSQPRGGVIIIYIWNFGDGATVNTSNPVISHVFMEIGDYNVTLTVIDSEGLSDEIIKALRVADYPTAEFTWSPPSPKATEQVTFNASMSQANSGTITTYAWDFGDGSPILTTGLPIATHTYSKGQDYKVTLTVINSDGLSSTISKTITILKANPQASFTCKPEVPIASQEATFNASQSYDPDGTIKSYTWDFGDGNITTTTKPIITHVYHTIGNYTVTLNVTDNDGLTASTSKTVKIITYPTADFTWSPSTPESSRPVTFNASMSQANSGVIVSYVWDFGDGNVTTTTDPIITHVYSFYGNYSVKSTVTNSEGLSASKEQTVTVVGCPPEASFDWQPIYPFENQTVTFDASISVPNGGIIVSYEWNFGDGSPPEFILIAPTITHEYSAYGQYTVTLKVSDSEYLSATVSKVIVIVAPPDANFTWSPQYPHIYEAVTFNASQSSPNGGVIVGYVWDFGDGNVTTTTNPIIIHVYQAIGNYTVTLNITDSEGLWNVTTEIVNVTGITPPEADFTYSPSPPYVFETITFNASMSSTNVGTITSYTWDFGDGNVTTLTVPTVIYAYGATGNYTVTLTIVTDVGLNDTISKLITVLPVCGPTAKFTWSPPSPAYNQTLTFNATASTPGWNGTIHPSIAYYFWDFGDGSSFNTTNSIVYHVFSQPGNYSVTLTVTDSVGGTDTVSAIIQVYSVAAKPWDVNGDGIVDIEDIYLVSIHYGLKPEEPGWDPRCDVNKDGMVDIEDLYIVALHYGETY